MKDLITLDHPAIVSGVDPAQAIDGQIEEGNRSRAKRQLEQPTLVKMTSDTPLIVSSRWSASKSVSSNSTTILGKHCQMADTWSPCSWDVSFLILMKCPSN
jgi:hypothetical protein